MEISRNKGTNTPGRPLYLKSIDNIKDIPGPGFYM